MRQELYDYYERELSYLRRQGAAFAKNNPRIAGRLGLEQEDVDPHVERILEGFAFLAARVHLKLDDELPQIVEAFLNVLYPHYLTPIPSLSIAKFSLDPTQGRPTTGYQIAPETQLVSGAVQGARCRFRTCYPVTVWPIDVTGASLESKDPADSSGNWERAVLKIFLRCLNGAKLSELKMIRENREQVIDSLRFYINGDSPVVYPLYEFLFNDDRHLDRVELHPGETGREVAPKPSPIELPPACLKAVGFERDEGLLNYTARSFLGYRLLTEYFAFPQKFHFFDVMGLDRAARAGFGERFEIHLHLRQVKPPRGGVSAGTFQLGCTPIVNIFPRVADGIEHTQQQHEYRVVPDAQRQSTTEVYSVEKVVSTDPELKGKREYLPFYSYRHADELERGSAFWYAVRRPSLVEHDKGSEVYLSLVDLDFNAAEPADQTLTVYTLCTNRDLPAQLPLGMREDELDVEEAGPDIRVRCLGRPTPALRPPLRKGAYWRLISHLSLNHLSLIEDEKGRGPDALREILSLYDFKDSDDTKRQIKGIARVKTDLVPRRIGSRIGAGFVRGMMTTIEFDEELYAGSSVFLFASVLERFLALYASVNSFSQLAVKTSQDEKWIKQWRPRTGEQVLL